jgi:hypothetical protein
MRNIPLDVLLTFPIPNYHNPVTRPPTLIIVNVIFLVVVFAAVVLRVYTRMQVKRWFGLDDIFIIIALVGSVLINASHRHGLRLTWL